MEAITGVIQRQEIRFEFRFDCLTTKSMLFSCIKLLHFSTFTWTKNKGRAFILSNGGIIFHCKSYTVFNIAIAFHTSWPSLILLYCFLFFVLTTSNSLDYYYLYYDLKILFITNLIECNLLDGQGLCLSHWLLQPSRVEFGTKNLRLWARKEIFWGSRC